MLPFSPLQLVSMPELWLQRPAFMRAPLPQLPLSTPQYVWLLLLSSQPMPSPVPLSDPLASSLPPLSPMLLFFQQAPWLLHLFFPRVLLPQRFWLLQFCAFLRLWPRLPSSSTRLWPMRLVATQTPSPLLPASPLQSWPLRLVFQQVLWLPPLAFTLTPLQPQQQLSFLR